MTDSAKSLYIALAEQVAAEGQKRFAYFMDAPQTQEEVRSIFAAMVARLELTDSMVRGQAGDEVAGVRTSLRNVTEGIEDLHRLGLQDVELLQEVKRSLEERRDQLLTRKPSSPFRG